MFKFEKIKNNQLITYNLFYLPFLLYLEWKNWFSFCGSLYLYTIAIPSFKSGETKIIKFRMLTAVKVFIENPAVSKFIMIVGRSSYVLSTVPPETKHFDW